MCISCKIGHGCNTFLCMQGKARFKMAVAGCTLVILTFAEANDENTPFWLFQKLCQLGCVVPTGPLVDSGH